MNLKSYVCLLVCVGVRNGIVGRELRAVVTRMAFGVVHIMTVLAFM
jgi:hypothetical protein